MHAQSNHDTEQSNRLVIRPWPYENAVSLKVVVGYVYINLTSSWSFLMYPGLIGDPVEFSELPTNKANKDHDLTMRKYLWIQPQSYTLVSYIF